MRCWIIIALHLIVFDTTAQDVDSVASKKKIELTTEAEPVGGYRKLLASLKRTISDGDTIGEKTAIPLYAVRIHINDKGDVDTAYVSIPHAACSIHRTIAEEIRKTKWVPATVGGKPVPFESHLYGKIHLTKSVQKKFRCRWGG